MQDTTVVHNPDGAEKHVPNYQRFEQKMSAKDKRVLFSHWLGNAYTIFKQEKYRKVRTRAWEKGGAAACSAGFSHKQVSVVGLGRVIRDPALEAEPPQEYLDDHFTGFEGFKCSGEIAPVVVEDDGGSSSSSDSDSSGGCSDSSASS